MSVYRMAHDSMVENEVKVRMAGPAEARALLEEAGYRVSRAREFEANDVYDTADGAFRGRDELIRIRRVANTALLTFKSADMPGPHKRRRELETAVQDAAALHAIFESMGLRVAFRYEKFRTEYRRPDQAGGLVTLDETPIGTFLELEGEPAWIDASARELGLTPDDYILASYGALYLESRRRAGEIAGDMTFIPSS